MQLRQIAYIVDFIVMSFALASIFAAPCHAVPCIVSSPRYVLTADIVDWSIKLGSGQTCRHSIRLADVTIESAKLVSQPRSGQVTIDGAEFSYSSDPNFHGADSFTFLVSGTAGKMIGSSTIRVLVAVLNGSSTTSAPTSHVRIPEQKAASQAVQFGDKTSSMTWQTLKIGAGGFITGIDIGRDGTKVVRADTYGALYYNPSTSRWQQIVTMSSMPDGYKGIGQDAGAYEIAIAPSNTQRFYMTINGHIFRSDNRGEAWIATNFARVSAGTSDSTRTFGRYLAVDPVNADVVYAGTPSGGLFVTKNGGGTWTQVVAVGAGSIPGGASQGGGNLIAFDPTSSVRAGVTQGIYVSTFGTGVYHSTDSGSSWTLTAGSPKTHNHLIVDQNGDVWLTEHPYPNNTYIYKYSKGEWSAVSLGYGTQGAVVAVDPSNAKHIYIGTSAGGLAISTDGGRTFTRPADATRVAIDIPWLAWTNESYMSAGDIRFDPSTSNKLYFAEGIGVWYSNPPTTNSTVKWVSQSDGIEQLVTNWAVSPPGGGPILSFWDRPVFYGGDLTKYPITHGVNNTYALIMGWSIDWASSDPSTIVCLCNFQRNDTSGYSSDGGRTWKAFDRVPSNSSGAIYGGCIAASTSTNFLWVQSNHGNPYVTTSGGNSWSRVNIAGIPTGGTTGWGFAYYLDRQNCAADRVKPNTFYMYNDGSGAAGTEGIYASTDGGATWSHTSSPRFNAAFNVQMRSVPGHAGHLFFTAGVQSPPHPANQPFYRSSDGGVTWQALADIREVYAFGFGKAPPMGSYPTIFIFGWVKNVMGIWRSDDNAATWTRISDGYPLGSFNTIKTIEGDSNNYGMVYVGFGGSGFAYGKLNFLLRRDLQGGNDNTPEWLIETG